MNFNDVADRLVEFPKIDRAILNPIILDGLQNICDNTWIWTEVLTFLTTAGTKDYTLTPSATDREIIGIKSIQKATTNTPQPTASDGSGAGGLTPGTDYSYRMTAYKDDYGETLPCAVVTHACPASGVITLTWDAVNGPKDGYYIYGNNGAGTTYTRMTSTTGLTYNDDGTDTPDGSTEPPTTSVLMKDISLVSENLMKWGNVAWRSVESDGISALIFDGINSMRTNRIPETSGIGFQAKAVLSPVAGYTDIPDIMTRYVETILEYCRGRVYSLTPPTKDWPWLNYTLGKFWLGEYRKSKSKLKLKTMSGQGAPMRIRMRKFV